MDAGARTGALKPLTPAPRKIVMGPEAVEPRRSGLPSPVTSPTAARRVIDAQPAPSERGRPNRPFPTPGYSTSWSPPAVRSTTSLIPSRSQSPTLSSWVAVPTVRFDARGAPADRRPLFATTTRRPAASRPTTSAAPEPIIGAIETLVRPARALNGPKACPSRPAPVPAYAVVMPPARAITSERRSPLRSPQPSRAFAVAGRVPIGTGRPTALPLEAPGTRYSVRPSVVAIRSGCLSPLKSPTPTILVNGHFLRRTTGALKVPWPAPG